MREAGFPQRQGAVSRADRECILGPYLGGEKMNLGSKIKPKDLEELSPMMLPHFSYTRDNNQKV